MRCRRACGRRYGGINCGSRVKRNSGTESTAALSDMISSQHRNPAATATVSRSLPPNRVALHRRAGCSDDAGRGAATPERLLLAGAFTVDQVWQVFLLVPPTGWGAGWKSALRARASSAICSRSQLHCSLSGRSESHQETHRVERLFRGSQITSVQEHGSPQNRSSAEDFLVPDYQSIHL